MLAKARNIGKRLQNSLLIGKRGVYLISCSRKLMEFRLVTWEQIKAQIEL